MGTSLGPAHKLCLQDNAEALEVVHAPGLLKMRLKLFNGRNLYRDRALVTAKALWKRLASR
jgi:hypothetical protein